jgi:glycosyltransferase involved in cell wall biosynthesis
MYGLEGGFDARGSLERRGAMAKPPRLRVLRVIARMNVGGPALVVSALARALDPERFEQRIITGMVGEGEEDYLELQAPDVSVDVIPGLGRTLQPFDDVRALAALHGAIRRLRPHIVHTHTAKAGALGRMAARAAGVPAIVHTFHGHLLHGYFSPPLTRAVVLAEKALARTTTRFFTEGAQVRDDLLAAGIGEPGQYRVVPPGVDVFPPLDPDVARKALGLPPDVPVIAFIGRLTAIKRPDRLIEVLTRARLVRPETVLAIAGEGDLLDDVRRRAAPHGDRVRFLGWRGDVGTVLAAADLVLLTSDNEGMPVSLIEAAMAGRPVVTTDVGSAAEVVAHGETGFVTNTEVDCIAEAVCTLLEDPPLRRRMGAAAARRAESSFSSGRHVLQTQELYEEIARERGLA